MPVAPAVPVAPIAPVAPLAPVAPILPSTPASEDRAFKEMSRSSIERFLMSLPVMSCAAPADTEAPRKKVMATMAMG